MFTTTLRNTVQRLAVLGLSLGVMGSATMMTATAASAAEYKGQRLDGRSFEAIALASGSQQAQEAKVTFSGYQALLHFEDGSYAIVDLENAVISDRDNIIALDRRQNIQWKLDLE